MLLRCVRRHIGVGGSCVCDASITSEGGYILNSMVRRAVLFLVRQVSIYEAVVYEECVKRRHVHETEKART